jgi:hypothetical protein
MDDIDFPPQAVVKRSRETHGSHSQEQPTYSYSQLNRDAMSSQQHNLSQHNLFATALNSPIIYTPKLIRPNATRWPITGTRQTCPSRDMPLNSHCQTLQYEDFMRLNDVAQTGPVHQDAKKQGAQVCDRTLPCGFGKNTNTFTSAEEAKHEQRKAEILQVLEPMLANADRYPASVLLCWGEQDCCQILTIKTSDPTDSVALWHEIKWAWYARKGSWRRYIPLYGVRKVSVVDVSCLKSLDYTERNTNRRMKISILGQDAEYPQKGMFIGSYASDDLTIQKRFLEQIITDYVPQEWPCPYNLSSGNTECFGDCVSYIVDGMECPEHRLNSAKRELLRLDLRRFLTLAFSTPSIVRTNNLLDDDLFISEK